MATKTITKQLKAHHDEMRKMVKDIKKDPLKFILLKKHLDVHHELEEDIFLSQLNDKKDIMDESLESQEEHYVMNILLLDLDDFPKDHPRWMVKFKVFEEILDHHLTEEEEDLFPHAEKKLDKKVQEEMGQQFEEMKKIRLAAALETKQVPEKEENAKPKK